MRQIVVEQKLIPSPSTDGGGSGAPVSAEEAAAAGGGSGFSDNVFGADGSVQ